MSAVIKAYPFSFPQPTGVAQHDGLALLQHVIAHDVTPIDLDAIKLALHVAPLAYGGEPSVPTITAVNRAVDLLSAAARRLSAEAKQHEAEKAARLAKVAALFDGLDDRPNAGPMAPIQPVPPTPPTPDAVHPGLDALAQELSAKTGIGLTEARTLLITKIKAAKQAAPEAA